MLRRLLRAAVCSIASVATALSCRQTPAPAPPRAWKIEKDGLSLVVSGVGRQADFYHSKDAKLPVRISFDPALVELRRVKEYKLWVRTPTSPEWKVAVKGPANGDLLVFDAPYEGRFGLHASVVYNDGLELFNPGPTDSPQAWFVLDRTAPELAWDDAGEKRVLGHKPTIELSWTAKERQFGRAPLELEFSSDDGATWSTIGEHIARAGRSRFSWRPPGSVAGDVLVRVSATDLAGHSSSKTIALKYSPFGDLPPGDGVHRIEGDGELVADASSEGDHQGGDATSEIDGTGESEVTDLDDENALAKADDDSEKVGEDASKDADSESAIDPEADLPDVVDERIDALVRLLEFESDCLRAGDEIVVRWDVTDQDVEKQPDLLDRLATLEYSSGAESDEWTLIGEIEVGELALPWMLPAESAMGVALRLTVNLPENESSTHTIAGFSIDASAPRVTVTTVPEQAGGKLSLALSGDDEGCGGVAAVRVFLRTKTEEFWTPLEEARTTWSPTEKTLALDLRELPQTKYDVFLAARDALGNSAPEPGPSSSPVGSFTLDTTPPKIALDEPVLDWVSGFETAITATIDLADCTPPIIVEGREIVDGIAPSEWKELRRLASLSEVTNGIPVQLPQARGQVELRVRVRDALGNPTEATIGPRAVHAPLTLTTFQKSGEYPSFAKESVAWTYHPVAAEVRDQLRVRVAYRAGALVDGVGEWTQIHDKSPADDGFEWVLPDGDPSGSGAGDSFLLRVRLYRGEDLVAETNSAPFRIGAFLKPVAISPESMQQYDLGRGKITVLDFEREEIYESGEAPSETKSAELTRIAGEARKYFEKALELDGKNHLAAFALAKLLKEIDGAANLNQIIRCLETTVALQREHAEAWSYLGAILIDKREYDRARASLEEAIRIQDTAAARYNLGVSLIFLRKPVEARAQFAIAIKDGSVPEDTIGDAWFYTANAYIQEGQLGRARAIYQEKRDLIPADFRANLAKRLESIETE